MKLNIGARAALTVVILGTLVAGCVGRYWTPETDRTVTLIMRPAEARAPARAVITTPTLLGWLLPGRPARVSAWGVDGGGRVLLLESSRGSGDVVTTARIVSRSVDRLAVAITVADPFLPLGRDAAGYFFVVRLALDPPIDPASPPAIVDVGSGQETPVTVPFELAP